MMAWGRTVVLSCILAISTMETAMVTIQIAKEIWFVDLTIATMRVAIGTHLMIVVLQVSLIICTMKRDSRVYFKIMEIR